VSYLLLAERKAVMLKRLEMNAGMRALIGLGGVGATAGFPFRGRERIPAVVNGPSIGAFAGGTPDPITSSVRLHVY
jgi:hypothetical protein